MKTNKELILHELSSAAEALSPAITSRHFDIVFQSEENPDYCIVIDGQLIATRIERHPGNIVDGLWEIHPHSYVAEWTFEGSITVEDEEYNIKEIIDFKTLNRN